MKVISIVGARPQFVKAAVVSRVIRERKGISELLVHTGQHYDKNMSDVFFDEMDIPRPAFNLGIGSSTHGKMTGDMLAGIERVLLDERPDMVLVYGDTNSTVAGALAAAKLNIPVAHVEAGLRSFNRRMPEEINRIVADHVSSMLFTPSAAGLENLRNEGIPSGKVHFTGDVMLDAVKFYSEKAGFRGGMLADLGLEAGKYVLSTLHRAENTDDPARLAALVNGLNEVSSDITVVLPLHPRTRKMVNEADGLEFASNVKLIDPVGYFDMLALMRSAALIATDSGGIQKEAYFFGKPCVTLRDETEWVELVDIGWNLLCSPTSAVKISGAIKERLGTYGRREHPYGSGDAGTRIVDILYEYVREKTI